MKYKVNELSGALLDAAVAECRLIAGDFYRWELISAEKSAIGRVYCSVDAYNVAGAQWEPSTDFCDGGPILERERITTECEGDDVVPECLWTAGRDDSFSHEHGWSFAPTLLVAAMRFYVRTKLGEEVDL